MTKIVKGIGYGLMVIGMLLVGMPTMAQQQTWQSTSIMQGSGSAYSPQVTAVGAVTATEMATTTYSPAKAPSGPRRGFDVGAETGQSDESPIGDAVLPMMLMAMLFAGVVYTRRKKALNR